MLSRSTDYLSIFPKLTQSFPNLTRSLLKISKVDPKTYHDFRWPEVFQSLPKSFKIFEVYPKFPKFFEVYRKTFDDFRSWPEEFQRFPMLARRDTKVSEVSTNWGEL